jgi:hypothetical protein
MSRVYTVWDSALRPYKIFPLLASPIWQLDVLEQLLQIHSDKFPPCRTLHVPNPATKLICMAQQIATSVNKIKDKWENNPIYSLTFFLGFCFDFSGNKYEQYV